MIENTTQSQQVTFWQIVALVFTGTMGIGAGYAKMRAKIKPGAAGSAGSAGQATSQHIVPFHNTAYYRDLIDRVQELEFARSRDNGEMRRELSEIRRLIESLMEGRGGA